MKHVDRVEKVQERATMSKLLGSLSHEERLRKPYNCVPILKEWLLRSWRLHFHKECKLCVQVMPGKMQLDTRGKLFPMRMISHWNNLSIMWEVVDFPTLDSTIQLAKMMNHLIQTVLLPAKIGPNDP